MGTKTKIEWSDSSWTPIRARRLDDGKVGVHCERVSLGCKNCYSATFNRRRLPNQGTGLDFTLSSREKVEIFLDQKILLQPLGWKRPRRVFVCSQTDLFADFVPVEFIWEMFAVMALAERHTFMVLTKRPERMRRLLADEEDGDYFWAMVEGAAQRIYNAGTGEDPSLWLAVHGPLKNVWVGVSAEDQETFDDRVNLLGLTPAALRFISIEPQLEWIDFGNAFDPPPENSPYGQIGWVIVGGESGPGARPFHVGWAEHAILECGAADIPVFIKQMGSRPQARNDRVADVWYYADGGDMDTLEGPDHPNYQCQGDPVTLKLKSRKGGDMLEWPANIRIREFPQ